MNNIAYLLALHTIEGFGSARLAKLLTFFGDPQLAWGAKTKDLLGIGIPEKTISLLEGQRERMDPLEYLEWIQKGGIKYLIISDNNYPQKLKEIYDPPLIIYYKGEFSPNDTRAIAVVGTRKVTPYGRDVTRMLARDIVLAGFTIVSGLARGVDFWAHKSALDAGGRTIAVLGGGLNRLFPAEHKALADEIAGGAGVVLSEFPPDYAPHPGNFPARNRIISGLSRAVLVTEAAEDSGSLITARIAAEQGRDVFAVPGPVTSSLSKGTAKLIQEGAKLVVDAKDILEEFGMDSLPRQQLPEVSGFEGKVLDCFQEGIRHIDEVCRMLKESSAKVSAALIKMEISGLVQNCGSGNYSKVV